MDTVLLSKCCKSEAILDEGGITCMKCEKECEAEEVCAECYGTGEVTTMEYVYAGEPHQAPIGTAPCPVCQVKDDDEYDDQQ